MMLNSQICSHLNEYVDISDHIDFAEALVDRYEWEPDIRERLCSQLRLIRNKQKDRCLNLSVVGEFSTGKSSFINALLGENLLVSSAIQGTTVVNTIIEYYDTPVMYVHKKDGSYDIVTTKSVGELSVRLSDITTNSVMASSINVVRVGIPSQLLAEGIRIIDTPGTNSTESWHEDTTRYAIKNLSDLSIVLTDGLHPLSKSLVSFIDENLSDIYNQCAFVVTYYDKLPERERVDVLHYIERKLKHELEIDEPKVFPYVAPAVLASKVGEIVMPEQEKMSALSSASQAGLLEIMWKNRHLSQIKKLLALTKEAYSLIEQSILSKRAKYEQEYGLLLKTQQTSLEPFIEGEKQRCLTDFGYKANDLRDILASKVASKIPVAKERVKDFIMAYPKATAKEIKTFISNEVPKECNRQARNVGRTSNAMLKSLLELFNKTMASFHGNFENQFEKLGILKVDLGNINVERPGAHVVSLDNLKESLDYMSKEVTRENWAMGGGGVAGAAIGTAILPGLGTVVGGFLGMVVGARKTPTGYELKRNACVKLSGQLDSMFRTVERDIISTFNDNVLN